MDLFALRHVPFLARRNYVIESQHMLLWGMFAGMFEGSVSSIIVAKTFNAGPWLIALVMATPMFANLSGVVWGGLATGRRKLPLFSVLAFGTALMIGSVALAPASDFGGWVFAAQIALARILLSGCVTIRASLWKHNYPALQRGRIAARLQMVRLSVGIATVFLVSLLFDMDTRLYVWVYPVAALIGCAAVLVLRRTHVRGEVLELKTIAEQLNDHTRTPALSWRRPFGPMIEVLKADRRFARYCLAMMFLGFANIMVMPLMTIIITKQLHLSYWHSCNLMEVLPRSLMMGSMLLWAGLFDRVGVVRFRVLNSIAWTSGAVACGVCSWIIYTWGTDDVVPFAFAVGCMALARVGHGLGMGGGAIAWNIGHLHFAEAAKAEVYMGTHVFLTGLRGLTAPFLGTWLYTSFYPPVAFIVAVTLSLIGLAIFRSMAKTETDKQATV